MNVVYVAGPYRSSVGPHGILAHIMSAREVAVRLWQQGYAVICPHTNSFMMDGACPDDVWLQGDLEIMRRCDLVVLAPRWEKSSGTAAEVAEAERLGIPVYEWRDGELKPLRYELWEEAPE